VKETIGISFHYYAPGAQAPQSLLLAVPPALGTARWRLTVLVDTVLSVVDLARRRAVDPTFLRPADVSGSGRSVLDALAPFLPAVFVPQQVGGQPGVPLERLTVRPDDYGQIVEAGPPVVLEVRPERGLVPGRRVVVRLGGTDLAPMRLVPELASVGDGLELEAPVVITETHVDVPVRVAASATAGPRQITVTTVMGSTTTALTVVPLRIAAVTPHAFSQGEVTVEVGVVVTGSGLAGATARFTTPLLTVQVTGQSDERLELLVTVPGIGPPPNPDDPVGVTSQDSTELVVTTPEGIAVRFRCDFRRFRWA
jgi:hypothetical protein